MQVCLIVPGPLRTLTGGHMYDRRMAEGLRALGHEVTVVELGGRLPDADQIAIYEARSAWSALPGDAVRLIDGLALPAFDGLPLHQVTGLIHHPASLETGVPEAISQRLRVSESAMFRDLPRIVVTSEQTAELMARDFGAARERISVIVPGIDELPRAAGSGGPACQVLSVGALIPRKGHDLLMRSLARLFDIEWELTIAGASDRDPVHANGLRGLAEELNISRRVRFIEAPDEAVWARTDVFALASWFEGYGVAIAEAQRRGIPVAVTNVGAVPSLVQPDTGVVCAPGDLEQYSKALRRLMFDAALRRDMGESAWQAARTLPSWDEQAERLAAVLAV